MFEFDEPKIFDLSQIDNSIGYKLTTGKKRENINNILSQMYSRTKVKNILDKYISDNNIVYDFVICTRFDYNNHIHIDFNNIAKDKIYFSNIHIPRHIIDDNFILTNTNNFLKIFDVYSNINNLINNQYIIESFSKINESFCINAEALILANIIYQFDDYLDLLNPTPLITNYKLCV